MSRSSRNRVMRQSNDQPKALWVGLAFVSILAHAGLATLSPAFQGTPPVLEEGTIEIGISVVAEAAPDPAPPAPDDPPERPLPVPEDPPPPEPPRPEPLPHKQPEPSPEELAAKRRAEAQAEEARQAELARQKLAEEQERARQEKIAEEQRQKEKAEAAARAREAAIAKKAAAARAEAKRQAALARKIVARPSATSKPQPRYPSTERRRGIEGRVMVAFTVDPSGRVQNARVSQSSGNANLDRAALTAVRKWKFRPARNGLGQPISCPMQAPVSFVLRG